MNSRPLMIRSSVGGSDIYPWQPTPKHRPAKSTMLIAGLRMGPWKGYRENHQENRNQIVTSMHACVRTCRSAPTVFLPARPVCVCECARAYLCVRARARACASVCVRVHARVRARADWEGPACACVSVCVRECLRACLHACVVCARLPYPVVPR